MARPRVGSGGGLAALTYVLRKGREAGGLLRLYRRLRSRNACKTCGLGMGGQLGGMRNEVGHFPEVCKKSVQAQAGDMAGAQDEIEKARGLLEARLHERPDDEAAMMQLSWVNLALKRNTEALHLAHATSVPFENLAIQMGESVRLDLASLQQKIVHRRRGGYPQYPRRPYGAYKH